MKSFKSNCYSGEANRINAIHVSKVSASERLLTEQLIEARNQRDKANDRFDMLFGAACRLSTCLKDYKLFDETTTLGLATVGLSAPDKIVQLGRAANQALNRWDHVVEVCVPLEKAEKPA